MYGSITGNAITLTDITGAPLIFGNTTTGIARSWSVARTPSGVHRWEWSAIGPKGSERGYAHSKAVAKSRALRAYEELADLPAGDTIARAGARTVRNHGAALRRLGDA